MTPGFALEERFRKISISVSGYFGDDFQEEYENIVENRMHQITDDGAEIINVQLCITVVGDYLLYSTKIYYQEPD